MSETTNRPMSDDQRHLAEIAGLQRDFDLADQQYRQSKAETAALKKIAEKKLRKLCEFTRGLTVPLPLFEVWRQTPIDDLGLPDGMVAILQEYGYDTVGKLADYTKNGGELTKIPHIGEAKAEAIVKALERFWAQRKADGEV